jgi:transcriptional regulator with XRE-family HTH domain
MPALTIRLPLHDPATLRWIMNNPRRGLPYTIRELAQAADCSPGTIGHLLSGRQHSTETERAARIAAILECDIAVLFAAKASTNLDTTSTRTNQRD